MIHPLLRFIEKERLFAPNTPVLLAVSGGMDSSILAELFHLTHQRFGIAHCNFQLRGDESNGDEQFVKDLAARLGVSFYVTRFETNQYAADNKISIQMAARKLRYEWFEKIRKENGYHFIATAHHQSDSIETALLNFVKGTGIAGLHGILPKAGNIIRPLLFASREEIEAFAKEKSINYRTDSSNALTKYERNRLRLEIIPQLKTINPAFEQSLAKSIRHFTDAEKLYNERIDHYIKKLLKPNGNSFQISIAALQNVGAKETVLYEMLKPFQFNEPAVQQIIDALEGESGKQFFSPTHRLLKDRTMLIISLIDTEQQREVLLELKNQKIKLSQLTIDISIKDAQSFSIPAGNDICCLDIAKLETPLLLRKWRKGDYFYPLGMKNKKKKVSDYLINRKLSLIEKENIYVLESGEKIACIIGERIDERFKIKASTKEILVVLNLNPLKGLKPFRG